MKTLIATLIVSVATATSAFAMDGNQNNLPARIAVDHGASAVQVSGFAVGFENALDTKHGGVPASLVRNYSASATQVSGFTGIKGDYDKGLDGNHKGIPASLR